MPIFDNKSDNLIIQLQSLNFSLTDTPETTVPYQFDSTTSAYVIFSVNNSDSSDVIKIDNVQESEDNSTWSIVPNYKIIGLDVVDGVTQSIDTIAITQQPYGAIVRTFGFVGVEKFLRFQIEATNIVSPGGTNLNIFVVAQPLVIPTANSS